MAPAFERMLTQWRRRFAVTRRGEKTTPSKDKTKKLKISKKTLKDLGAKDARGVKGGGLVTPYCGSALCTKLATFCRLQCCAATGTCGKG
jgi:hypothetical protein